MITQRICLTVFALFYVHTIPDLYRNVFYYLTPKIKIWTKNANAISQAFIIKATMPAFSILHAVISVICRRKLKKPTAIRRIQPSNDFGKISSHTILSNEVKWRTSLTIRVPMTPTMLKHAIMLNVQRPKILLTPCRKNPW